MKTILLISPYWKEEHRWMVSTVKLAELWQRLGYRVVVACMGAPTPSPSPRGRGGHFDVQRISDTLVIYRKKDIFFPDPWNYGIAFGFSALVRRIIREERPDSVVVNKLLFWTSLCIPLLRLTGRRPIVLVDALVGMTWWPRGALPRIGAALYAWTLGWLELCCATRVVLFHPQPEGLLKRLLIAHKTEVIPTGIDPAPYTSIPQPLPPEEEGEKHRHSPPPLEEGVGVEDVLTLTYVGRLESVKGVEDFLAAAVTFPDVKIQVAGWSKPDHPLVAQYRDRVSFLGLRHDIPEVLRTTDIFVLPSYSEGLSNALMEAMASGCACIASDVGGNRYLLQNGVSGFLYSAGDRAALQAHLRRLIEDPAKRRSLGESARRRIAEHFSWEKVGRLYKKLFENVMDNC